MKNSMKKILLVIFLVVASGWSIPKPMESVENYNIVLIHGADGSSKCFDLLTSDY